MAVSAHTNIAWRDQLDLSSHDIICDYRNMLYGDCRIFALPALCKIYQALAQKQKKASGGGVMRMDVETTYEVWLVSKLTELVSDDAMGRLEKEFRKYLTDEKLRFRGRMLVKGIVEMGPSKGFTVFRAILFTDPGDSALLQCFISSRYPDGEVIIILSPRFFSSWHEMELSQEVGS